MKLKIRNTPYIIPRYSLTGDILSYKRCELQYRYYNGSSLPPSRPVQFWTGEFVHNSLEEAYSIWKNHQGVPAFSFPWPMNISNFPRIESMQERSINDIGEIGDRVEARLVAMQKSPRSRIARESAYNRVYAAINILAPYLFPLITSVEEKINGSRNLITQMERADKYELTGIADVISHVEYAAYPKNKIVSLITEQIPSLTGEFDIIVDYKAARRPTLSDKINQHHKWQVQTYAWLRNQNSSNIPIRAGIIVYINELFPTKSDLNKMKQDLINKKTDVFPDRGSADYYALYRWNGNEPLPKFTSDFLIRRAIRIISSSEQEAEEAVREIDNVVQSIERCVEEEHHSGTILENWTPNGIPQDCAACDFRRFCVPENSESWDVQAPG